MPSEVEKPTFTNDAFISYSRKDREFAARLEKALRNYKPPRGLNLPQRNLVVFRDEEDFTGGEYHASLEKHLKSSRKMIVICSPHARQSQYVNDEIRQFAQERGKENITPVLISGIPNNEAKTEEEGEKAFPEALCEVMEMPLAASYVGFNLNKDNVKKGIFYGPWYKILADLYDLSRAEIEQREKKRQIKRRNVTIGIVSGVALGLSISLVLALISRSEAIRQRRIALARQLVVQSQAEYERDPQRGLLLVLEAIATTERAGEPRILIAEEVLRQALAKLGGRDLPAPPSRPLSLEIRMLAPGEEIQVTDKKNETAPLRDLPAKDLFAEPIVLRGHEGVIFAVAISPNNHWLVTCSADNTARLWDLTAKDPGGASVVLRSQPESITPMAISPDNRWLVAGNWGEDLWCLSARNPIVLRGHDGVITAVAISPDNHWLATGSEDQTARLWDLSAKDPAAKPIVLRGHEGVIFAAAISPDNRWLVTGGEDKTARLWDLSARDPATASIVLRGHESEIRAVAISLDGHWLVTGSDDQTARLWNLKLEEVVALACRKVGRNLTKDEWAQYMGNQPYQETCSEITMQEGRKKWR